MSDPSTPVPGGAGDGYVWYFAYGSNMQSATFRGRRGIPYRRALAARVPGWRLVFDKPGLLQEGHGYANIVPDAAASVLGVLYEITAADLAHVELTEGVMIGNYRRVRVATEPLIAMTDPPVTACSLASDRHDPSRRPSTRYLARLIEGALEHGLPPEYVAYLRTVPAVAPSPETERMQTLIDEFLRRRSE